MLKRLKDFSNSYTGQISLVLSVFIVVRIISLSVFYNGFLVNFEKLGHVLPVSDQVPFHSWSIILSALLHPVFLIALVALYVGWFYRSSNSFNYGFTEKVLISCASFFLSWELCTYDYNYFLDRSFIFDRVVLLLIPFLLWRLPVLLPFYIAAAFVYRAQFNYPVDGFELFDKRILFDILMMYLAFSYVMRRVNYSQVSFLFIVLCIVSSNYFMSGIKKLIISPHGFEWLLHNDLTNLFHNVHFRGWLAGVSETTIQELSEVLSKCNFGFKVFTLLIELSALFVVRSRKGALLLLLLFLVLHIGFFIFGSMLFWKWMAVDIVLLILLMSKKEEVMSVFSSRNFKASVVIVLLSLFWLRPYMIGWWDTKVNQFFSCEVVSEHNETYELSRNDMNPYHQWFQYDDFWFLVNEKHLAVSSFGYTNSYKLYSLINTAGAEEILSLEKEKGRNDFDPIKKKAFEDFIKQFFCVTNGKLGVPWFVYLRPPHHLHSGTFQRAYSGGDKVRLFRIYLNKTMIVNGAKVSIEKKMMDEILIPS